MEANKSECEKCIRIAQSSGSIGDYEKAIKFLSKAQKLYPSEQVNKLLQEYTDKQAKKAERGADSPGDANGSASSPTSDNANTADPSSARSRRKENAEQSDAVKKIKNCRDFYEILGVPKTATEADLKKAYKKLALQFHPDKNKTNGATEAFKAIGKAFSVLSDAQKRKQYDNYGPESFEASSGETSTRSSHGHRSQYGTHYSWNEEEFSADELFNLFFGGTTAHSSHTRRRHQQAQQHAHASNGANFTFTQSQNNYAVLFQLMPILLIVVLSLLSNFMIGEPVYNLQKTSKYSVRRMTNEHQVTYYVKSDFKVDSREFLNKLEKQVEEELLVELRQSCFREKSYKETAIWRARNYGDERLLKKAHEYETPSCTRINQIFSAG